MAIGSIAQEAAGLINSLQQAIGTSNVNGFEEIESLPPTKSILNAAQTTRMALICEYVDRIATMSATLGDSADTREIGILILTRLLRRDYPFTEQELLHLLNRTADLETICTWILPYLPNLVKLASRHVESQGLTPAMNQALRRVSKALEWISNAPERKLRATIETLRQGSRPVPLQPGEAWSDAALADLESATEVRRVAWIALLTHCQSATGSRPSAQWLAEARGRLKAITPNRFREHVLRWFPLVDKPRTGVVPRLEEWEPSPDLVIDPHMDILRGLVWCCTLVSDDDIVRGLRALGLSAYRKVPGRGPRAVRIGNACIYALSRIGTADAIGQLAMLKVKVKFGTAQKEIGKALNAAAEALGVPRDQIEEMGVPSYGMEEVGVRRETFGEVRAELRVEGRNATIAWFRPSGKALKSAPASVKTDFADDLKELKQAQKDIAAMLPAQAQRIDSLYLQQKSWTFAVWRERYLDHPLIGTIARRLIWTFGAGENRQSAIWNGGAFEDMADRPLQIPDDAAPVELWHPIGRTTEEVLAWRGWIERHRVQQPFKQAHREVYLLTDAERATHVYSNRFAAHLIRQHQFNALAVGRGWKNKLRLFVDAEYPPASRELPAWGLRAEFWVEGAGDEYGEDTNDSGVYLYLSTDQVRFYRLESAQVTAHAGGGGYHGPYHADVPEPVPLDQIPSLVFSEIMRDVDLYVGVASVGNDPAWVDSGTGQEARNYWYRYSFGDLGESAKTRKAVLERLVPRLSIAPRCSFADKFLVVRGDLRTYKIHLGSGNILMEPDDRYLCIVPGRSAAHRADGADKIFLPFEGDQTLSVVLSKAFLLAEDRKIADPTITRQIAGG